VQRNAPVFCTADRRPAYESAVHGLVKDPLV
jgi:hypothetical protein